jgi:hypothetical protein
MFRDDRLEFKNGTLQLKMLEDPWPTSSRDTKKPRRSTKFDFSGTNYETCTLGHVSCLEAMLEEDPDLIETICQQAKEIAAIRKPAPSESHDDKYSTLQTDPEFAARALLFKKGFGKKSNRRLATHKLKDDKEFKGRKDEDLQVDASGNSNDHDDNVDGNLNEGNDC